MEKIVFGGIVVLLMAGGCLTREALYGDLREARGEAYRSWLRVRAEGDIPVPVEQLSLSNALEIALLYNKSLQSKLQGREAARGEVVAAYQQALPKVGVEANIGRGTVDSESIGVVARQPLFRGGGVTAGLRAARLYAFWSDEEVRHTAQQVIRQATAAYYSALLAESLRQVNFDAVASAEAHLADVRIKRENGVASKYDELRAQVDVANFRAELIKQENNLVLAKTTLLRALGTATDATINLSDQLERQPVSIVLEDGLATAYSNRPDLLQAEINIRLQREKLASVRSRYLPEVDLVLSAGGSKVHGSGREWRENNRAGLDLYWPLLDGFGREGMIMAEEARLRQREIELADVEEDVFLDIQQALLNLKNAEEFVASQQLSLEHAEEGLRLTMTGYREGVNTEVEIVDARSSLTEARGNYYQALYDHSMSRLSLEYAMGVLGQGLFGTLDQQRPERRGVEGAWLNMVERMIQPPARNGRGADGEGAK